MNNTINNIRKDYQFDSFNENQLPEQPIVLFESWLNEALELYQADANAFCLSTVGKKNRVHSRILLLRNYENYKFSFYTNYLSKKGLDIDYQPYGSILFYWDKLGRQIRIEGEIKKLSYKESDKYWKSRPKESQASAAVSPQSKIITSKDDLIIEREKLLVLDTIKRPDNWGGYFLKPNYFEFWQGRPNRFHDRFEYKLRSKNWTINRLAP